MWELLIISVIRSLASFKDQLDIKGASVISNGKLLKYHSPLNKVPFVCLKLTTVEWLDLINLAKVLTEGKITNKIFAAMNYKYTQDTLI